MTKPMLLADFARLPPAYRARRVDGLAAAIDRVAAIAPPSHGFLRYGWFAAALAAYGGTARTVIVEADGDPVIALPMVAAGPGWLGAAQLPGSYWPFRSFPAGESLPDSAYDVLVGALGVRALRIGPVYDDDAAAAALVAVARRRGWAVLDRIVAHSWRLDLTAPDWPRGSTLRKNRFHEKHLAAHGALDWRMLDGAALAAGGFDLLAQVEQASWIAARTDGRDAKFTRAGHGAFWRGAAVDPVLAAAMSAALLMVDGKPAAFSFDLDAGALRYAVANSYDPAFAKHSPGKLLHYRNLIAARARGTTHVDWGAGDSGYKAVLGAERGPAIRDWLIVRPGAPALIAALARGVWRRSGQVVDACAPPADKRAHSLMER